MIIDDEIDTNNYVIEEVYYLQVKLLSSETTEIIGSSLTNAQSESGFLELCNNAILLLFK